MQRSATAVTALGVAVTLAVGATFTQTGVAHAATSDVDRPTITTQPVVTTAVPGTTTVVTHAGATSAGITLPGALASPPDAAVPEAIPAGLFNGVGDPVLSTWVDAAVISSYSTGAGTQTLITINSPAADREYRFPLSLPAEARVDVEDDGSITIRAHTGEVLGGFRSPWAYDATGRPVPTHFRLDGAVLVQTVDFDEDTAFPVTADPSDFWGWTTCVATVTAEVAANALVAGKVAKLVARFGSIQRTFQILYRAWNAAASWNNKWQAVVAAGGGLAGELLGVTSIKEACFDS